MNFQFRFDLNLLFLISVISNGACKCCLSFDYVSTTSAAFRLTFSNFWLQHQRCRMLWKEYYHRCNCSNVNIIQSKKKVTKKYVKQNRSEQRTFRHFRNSRTMTCDIHWFLFFDSSGTDNYPLISKPFD